MDTVDMKLDWVSNVSREALESVVIEYLFQLAGRQTRRACLCARLRVVLRTFPNGLGSIISWHTLHDPRKKELFSPIIPSLKKLKIKGIFQTHEIHPPRYRGLFQKRIEKSTTPIFLTIP